MFTTRSMRVTGTAIAVLILSCGAERINAEEPQGEGAALQLDIEAQPIDDSLNEFAQQSGLQVVFFSEVIGDFEAPAAIGDFESSEAALQYLLAGTGLGYRFVNERTVAIQPISADDGKGPGAGKSMRRPVAARPAAQNGMSTARTQAATLNAPADSEAGRERPQAPIRAEIVVTGTRLRGISPESAPLTVFGRDEIENSGASTVQEFFRTVTQNAGAGIGEQNYEVLGSGASVSEQGAALNLRGLGNRATLTLLNGQRMAPAGLSGQTVDVSLIPLSMVERIEILSVGASAIYGSDAVGGVVNFVLREDFQGAETDLKLGTPTNGDGDELEMTQLAGTSWTGGNAMISYQYRSQDEVLASGHDFLIDVPAETFFLPASESHAVFGSLSHSFTEQLSAGLTGLYSERDSQRDRIGPNGLVESRAAEAEAFTIGGDITYEWADDWAVSLSGSVSRNDSQTEDEEETEDGTFRRAATSEGNSREVTLTVTGTPLKLPAGPVSIAFGGQHRYSDFGIEIDFTDRPDTLEMKSIDSNAAFIEALLPIVSRANEVPGIDRLELNLAVRYEDYGGTVGSTVDPMLGILWAPSGDVSLRSTYGTSFRAPLPAEINGTHVLFTNGDWDAVFADQNDPSRANGVPLFALGVDAGIVPEESETFTVGIDYAPERVQSLELAVTYFNTEYSDRIATPTPSFAGVIGNPEFEPLIDRNPDIETLRALFDSATRFSDFRSFLEPDPMPPVLGLSDFSLIFDNRRANISITETSGVDFQGSFEFETDDHGFGFSLNATYLLAFDDTLVEGAPVIERLDTVFNSLDLKARAGAWWRHRGFTGHLFVNYSDDYDDLRFGPAIRVDSFATVDIGVGYDFGADGRDGWLSDTRLFLSVLNCLDEDPPFVNLTGDAGAAYDPTNASGRGRFVSLSLKKVW